MPEAPNLAVLLAPVLTRVPPEAQPRFLALLERGAAERYREWAKQAPAQAAGLFTCAAREEEIAERVEELFPAGDETITALAQLLPQAREIYYGTFAGLSLREQWRVQASAERQGAAAWRTFTALVADANIRHALEACAKLEEENATYLEGVSSS